MASLGVLKRSMGITLLLVSAVFFALIMVLVYFLIPGTGIYGFIIIFLLTGLFILFQWAIGPAVVKWSTKLQYLKPGENRFLENMVSELCRKSDVPYPKLAIVNNPTPNAFVFGRSLKSSTLAVHTGLLERLNQQEIKAVLAHEIGHLRHKDVIIMTVVSAIPILAYMLARSFLWGATGSRNRNAGAIIIVALASFVIYLVSQLLVMRLSRLREYYADSYSAFVTGDPHALSSALAKISYGLSLAQSKKETTGLRAFYIGDPSNSKREISQIMRKKDQYDLDGNGVLDERELELAMEKEAEGNSWSRANELFSTHPSTFKRILNLKQIEEEISQVGHMPKDIYKHI